MCAVWRSAPPDYLKSLRLVLELFLLGWFVVWLFGWLVSWLVGSLGFFYNARVYIKGTHVSL